MEKYHFNSPEAYALYASDLLKTQLEKRLGEFDTETPDVMDWQLGQTRTHPSDQHNNRSFEDVALYPNEDPVSRKQYESAERQTLVCELLFKIFRDGEDKAFLRKNPKA